VSKLTVRRVIVLILVAACCLLVVPGMAGAGVRTKYRAEYKASLNNLKNVFNIYAQGYDNARAASNELRITMMATTDHDLLVAYQNQALIAYNANLGKPAEWNTSYAKMVNAFKGKASHYFATAKQQTRFKTACDGLKTSARKLILLANVHVYHSFQDLSNEPPGYDTAGLQLDYGDEDAAAGHEGFDKRAAALKALL
jgi:type II secretory pathway pseudopilin PulG